MLRPSFLLATCSLLLAGSLWSETRHLLVPAASDPPQDQAAPQDEKDKMIAQMRQKIARLEKENEVLRAKLSQGAGSSGDLKSLLSELKERKPVFGKMKVEIPAVSGPPAHVPQTTEPGDPVVRQSAGQLPAGEASRVVMKVEGVPVPYGEIHDLLRFAKTFVLGSEERATRYVLENAILPCKVMEARHHDEIDALREKAAELRESVTTGDADFAALAKSQSGDPASAARGGLVDEIQRETVPLMLAKNAFETNPGEVSPVFISPLGVHLLKVEDRKRKSASEVEIDFVISAREILLPYKVEGVAVGDLLAHAKKIAQGCTVELFDRTYRTALPTHLKVIESYDKSPQPMHPDGHDHPPSKTTDGKSGSDPDKNDQE